MQRVTGVYKVTNIESGKVYVGASTDVYKRWQQHSMKYKRWVSALNDDIQLLGVSKFTFQLLEECSAEDLDAREAHYIASAGCVHPAGYNSTTGGNAGKRYSEALRSKLSAAHVGHTPWNKGVPFTPEHKANLRKPKTRSPALLAYWESLKGKPSPQKGKKFSPEVCAKMSESARRRRKATP